MVKKPILLLSKNAWTVEGKESLSLSLSLLADRQTKELFFSSIKVEQVEVRCGYTVEVLSTKLL